GASRGWLSCTGLCYEMGGGRRMSSPYTSATPAASRGPLGSLVFWAVVLGVTLATLGAVLLADPLLAIAPVAAVGLLMAVIRLPLRTSVGLLIVASIGVDDHQDGEPAQWKSPLSILGDIMKERLDQVLHVPGLAVTGLEIALVVLLAIYVWRRAT